MTNAQRRVAGQVSRRWVHPRADERWKLRAQCVGEEPELWFPKGEGERLGNKHVRALDATARAICSRCPVTAECLTYALELDLRYGTWGGLTETDRAKLTGRRPE